MKEEDIKKMKKEAIEKMNLLFDQIPAIKFELKSVCSTPRDVHVLMPHLTPEDINELDKSVKTNINDLFNEDDIKEIQKMMLEDTEKQDLKITDADVLNMKIQEKLISAIFIMYYSLKSKNDFIKCSAEIQKMNRA